MKKFDFVKNHAMKQTLKYIYDRLEEQLRYAETKHSISITLASALTVFSAAYLESSTSLINALSAISIILSLVSVIYSFVALSAKRVHFYKTKRSASKSLEENSVNLLYFRDIAKFSPTDFAEAIARTYPLFKGYKPDQLDNDLSKQVVATAKTISAKFLYFNFALSFLIASLFCESAVIILKGLL